MLTSRRKESIIVLNPVILLTGAGQIHPIFVAILLTLLNLPAIKHFFRNSISWSRFLLQSISFE